MLIKSIDLGCGDVSKLPEYLGPKICEYHRSVSELVFHFSKHKLAWVKLRAVGWKKAQLHAVKPEQGLYVGP